MEKYAKIFIAICIVALGTILFKAPKADVIGEEETLILICEEFKEMASLAYDMRERGISQEQFNHIFSSPKNERQSVNMEIMRDLGDMVYNHDIFKNEKEVALVVFSMVCLEAGKAV